MHYVEYKRCHHKKHFSVAQGHHLPLPLPERPRLPFQGEGMPGVFNSPISDLDLSFGVLIRKFKCKLGLK